VTDERAFWEPFLSDKGDRSNPDPDKVRTVELSHQPPGRERMRVTVVSTTGHVRVFTAHKSLLATVLEELYAAESET
jgi:hypothetical protein